MSRIHPISGFPEWLPKERLVERHILETLRKTFELHGYAEIETRAVEPVEHLLAKGETSKEVYLLRRLQEDPQSPEPDTLGLHFDLTVPLSRYVVENAGQLIFPLKRYQIQKVWRGERPQDGRFREFYQADIDVIGDGELPFHYEAEMPIVMAQAFQQLKNIGLPEVKILTNNRKICQGFYQGIGLDDVDGALRTIDKLAKIGEQHTARLLIDDNGATPEQAEAALKLASIRGTSDTVVAQVHSLGVRNALLDEGLFELAQLLKIGEQQVPGVIQADLSIARGLDYYTGSVYETIVAGHEDLGSICSGGRYDSLATDGKKTYPGVGISVGVTRLVSRLLRSGVNASRTTPAAVLVAVWNEDDRAESLAIAQALRARGIPTDLAPTASKLGRQIRYADRLGIPFVWFPAREAGQADEVKDIRTGIQEAATPTTWQPPERDLRPEILIPHQ